MIGQCTQCVIFAKKIGNKFHGNSFLRFPNGATSIDLDVREKISCERLFKINSLQDGGYLKKIMGTWYIYKKNKNCFSPLVIFMWLSPKCNEKNDESLDAINQICKNKNFQVMRCEVRKNFFNWLLCLCVSNRFALFPHSGALSPSSAYGH